MEMADPAAVFFGAGLDRALPGPTFQRPATRSGLRSHSRAGVSHCMHERSSTSVRIDISGVVYV
jgi:hypothetical protein